MFYQLLQAYSQYCVLQEEDAVCVYIHGDNLSVSSPTQQSMINGWQVTGKMCFK
jgi:hypothetical protein